MFHLTEKDFYHLFDLIDNWDCEVDWIRIWSRFEDGF